MGATTTPTPSATHQHLKSNGIVLHFDPAHGWTASVDYSTWQHANPECIEGSICTRYYTPDIVVAIDRAKEAAERIGVIFQEVVGSGPTIYVEGDGEDPKASLPGNWREIVRQQCERLGWTMVYEDAATPTCAAPDQVQ